MALSVKSLVNMLLLVVLIVLPEVLLNWLVLMISLLLKTPLCGEGKTRNLTSDNAQTTPRHQQTTDIQKAKEAKRIIIGR